MSTAFFNKKSQFKQARNNTTDLLSNQNALIKYLKESARAYSEALDHRTFLIIYGRGKDLKSLEINFKTRNFCHLAGVSPSHRKNDPVTSTKVYINLLNGTFSIDQLEKPYSSKINDKRDVFNLLVKFSKRITNVSTFRGGLATEVEVLLDTDLIASSPASHFAVGAVKEGDGYVPNTLLKVDRKQIERMSQDNRLLPVLAIFSKVSDEERYSQLDKVRKGTSIDTDPGLKRILREHVDMERIHSEEAGLIERLLPDGNPFPAGEGSSPGRLVIVSGPSGAGKTTLVGMALTSSSINAQRVITCTTRPPREGEHDGVDYRFLDEKTFSEKVGSGEFAEHASVHGRHYGTLHADIDRILEAGSAAIIISDPQGAATLRASYPDVRTVFIDADDASLEARLRARGGDARDMERRLADARGMREAAAGYDIVIVNGDGDSPFQAARDLMAAIDDGLEVGIDARETISRGLDQIIAELGDLGPAQSSGHGMEDGREL